MTGTIIYTLVKTKSDKADHDRYNYLNISQNKE